MRKGMLASENIRDADERYIWNFIVIGRSGSAGF
jgi:hypothetical protein